MGAAGCGLTMIISSSYLNNASSNSNALEPEEMGS
jgi:hypothetical protein